MQDFESVITSLEEFAQGIFLELDQLDWIGKQKIIRAVVKRIEIGDDQLNIIYRVGQLANNKPETSMQHCWNGTLRS